MEDRNNTIRLFKKYTYPQAAYISICSDEFSGISLFSPIGDNAACIPGPSTNPSVWKSESKDMCVILSLGLVALATYNRFGAMFAKGENKGVYVYRALYLVMFLGITGCNIFSSYLFLFPQEI